MIELLNNLGTGFVTLPVLLAIGEHEEQTQDAAPQLNEGHWNVAMRLLEIQGLCSLDAGVSEVKKVVSLKNVPTSLWALYRHLLTPNLDRDANLQLCEVFGSFGMKQAKNQDAVDRVIEQAVSLAALFLMSGGVVTLDDEVRSSVQQCLTRCGYRNAKGKWAPNGAFLSDRAAMLATYVSYSPMLLRMKDLLFGDCGFLTQEEGKPELHLDRRLNVIGSGAQHDRYFSDLAERLNETYQKRAYPQAVVDTGCGDGTLLKRLFEENTDFGVHGVRAIGADLHEPARRQTAKTLADLNHDVVKADISDPQSLRKKLERLNIDPDEVLHVRSFLDHEVRLTPDDDSIESERWKRLQLTGIYVDPRGSQLSPLGVFQSYVNHFREWRKICGKHGLAIVDLHCLRMRHHLTLAGRTNATAYEALHSWSGQRLLEADNYLLAAASAGLMAQRDSSERYPRHEEFTNISLNHFVPREYRIRPAVESDFEQIVQFELKQPSSIRCSEDEIRKRLSSKGGLVFVATKLESDDPIGVMFTQAIGDRNAITASTNETLSSLATLDGDILQLLSFSVASEYQDGCCASDLLDLVLQWAKYSGRFQQVVGVSRCARMHFERRDEFASRAIQSLESGGLFDPIIKMHTSRGAELAGLVPNFRPMDDVNFGMGVIVQYGLQDGTNVSGHEPLLTDKHLAKVLEAIDGSYRYDATVPLLDLGLDSLELLEFRYQLEQLTGHSIGTDFLFENPTGEKIMSALNDLSDKGESRSGMRFRPRFSASPTEASRKKTETIAIVGMGCRFPGEIESADALWELLVNGQSVIEEVPSDRWDLEEYYDSRPETPGKMWSRKGGFVSDFSHFDASFFGISRREAQMMDPQHRLLLETTWHALENAGVAASSLQDSNSGVFVGIGGCDYFRFVMKDRDRINAHCATGTFQSTASGRLSYLLGIHGPSMSIDTACSSSLLAIHHAVRSLQLDECELAIAGGVSILFPEVSINFTKARMLSPEGVCKTFDARADGYVRGEGCGMVILKRLDHAIRDGDRIHAVVRGSGTNQDGKSNGLTAPNGRAQQWLLKRVLETSGVAPEMISYVEAHGTGTSLGDPIEANALLRGLRKEVGSDRPIYFGSVKTNIGHLEAASGVAGLIKSVQCLQNGLIPPHLNFEELNPGIDAEDVDLRIPVETTALPDYKGDRIIAINSFGFSGTNVSMLVQEYQDNEAGEGDVTGDTFESVCLSAKSESSLGSLRERYVKFLRETNVGLSAIAETSKRGRDHYTMRLAVVGKTREEVANKLEAASLHNLNFGATPHIAFLFSGQGAQYSGMGRELYDESIVFRERLDSCCRLFDEYLSHPLREVMFDPDRSEYLNHTSFTQPALFAFEYAMAHHWMDREVIADCCIGHSIGEIAAATIAEVLTLESATAIIAKRAALLGGLPAGGGMVAVLAKCDAFQATVSKYPELVVAAMNSPRNFVVSGPIDEILAVSRELTENNVKSVQLRVSHAFHSPMVADVAGEFVEYCRQFRFSKPSIPFFSNVSGNTFDGTRHFDADYLGTQLISPVRFSECVVAASDSGADVFLEVGPGRTLCGLAKTTIGNEAARFVPSLEPNISSRRSLLDAESTLYVSGTQIRFDDASEWKRVGLPGYPFDRRHYWFEEAPPNKASSSECGPAPQNQTNPLSVVEAANGEIHFAVDLNAQGTRVLLEHVIQGQAIFPATGYLAMLAEVGAFLGDRNWSYERCSLDAPIPISPKRDVQLHGVMTPVGRKHYRVAVAYRDRSLKTSDWHEAFHCNIMEDRRDDSSDRPAESRSNADLASFYEHLEAAGYSYGKRFRQLERLEFDADSAVGNIKESGDETPSTWSIACRLDAAMHAVLALRPDDGLYVPIGWDSASCEGDLEQFQRVEVHRTLSQLEKAEYVVNVRLTGGNAEAHFDGLRMKRLGPSNTNGKPNRRTVGKANGKVTRDLEANEVGPELNQRIDPAHPVTSQISALEVEIQDMVASILFFEDGETVPLDAPLKEMGLDSVMAMELQLGLEDLAGKSLSSDVLLKQPSVRALTKLIHAEQSA